MTTDLVVAAEDPRTPDVVALLEAHLAFCRATSPPEAVHALDLDGLTHPAVTFVAARRHPGLLLGVGAIKRLDAAHREIKSMHTSAAARGQGVARLVLDHLLDLARSSGARRVSLETGSMAEFEPARSLYLAAGFVECGPFSSYPPSPHSTFMTLAI